MDYEKHYGKVVKHIEIYEDGSWATIHFTHGSSIDFTSRGSEDTWLVVYEND